MQAYQFSARWKRNRAAVVRPCEFDNRPCEFCPRRCEYGKRLRLLELKVHGPLDLNFRKQLFAAARTAMMLRRPKA